MAERLTTRAQTDGRSLDGEASKSASGFSLTQTREIAAQWQARYLGRQFTDSSDLLSEDRSR